MAKKIIVMIDNDEYFLSKWKETLGGDVDFLSYLSLSDFEDDVIDKNEKIFRSECIIVDFEFGNTNAGKKDFASYIRDEHQYKNPILMCSLHDRFGEYDSMVRASFDAVIDKTPLTSEELSKLLKSIKKNKS